MNLLKRLLIPHWPSIYGFGLALVAANLIGRIVAGRVDDGTELTADAGELVSMIAYLSMAAVAIAAGLWWGVRRRRQEIVPELLPVFVVVTLLSVLVNPLIARIEFPSVDGIFSQVVLYFVSLALGAFIGYLVVMALGVDHYGRELKATKRAFEKKANPARAA
ncbi:hypothetical protein [Glycomyces xiaoerkulensis]|uniref:hypothetical protein n=1 Tax=Glycomyces xiaoerkulensis TaxID=2038139 RepID=UPI000C257789|nr:hypothetical protein [Glycomyces xiaoerkulensis]